MIPWRLIVDDPASGAWNMAVDRAIHTSRTTGGAPTLRLYRFSPPAVTLGRFQGVSDVDLAFCRERGFHIVRRPTGGRGVLHDDEVTYSIVAGTADGVPRGVAASYRHLCSGVVRALAVLGVRAEITVRQACDHSPACYLQATGADLSVGSAKIAGSAQIWCDDVCLQHGSFVIDRDAMTEAAVFGLDEEAGGDLSRKTTTLTRMLGYRPSTSEVVEAMILGMSEALGIRFERASLFPREWGLAEAWAEDHRLA